MRKINSETKLAVSLLLSVSVSKDSCAPHPPPSSSNSSSSCPSPPSHESPLPPHGLSATTLQRHAALARFREKKARRKFHNKVRYAVRKRLAEARPRYKGRFSKPPPKVVPESKQVKPSDQ